MLKPGDRAPDFKLEGDDGKTHTLAEFSGKTLILYFYPRDNTPGCTIEAEGFRDAVPALRKLGAVVLGVSKDSIASHCKFRDKHGLTFVVLSDPGNQIAHGLGVLSPPRGIAVRGVSQALGADVAGGNGDGTDRLPMPTTVVVDATGTIRWIDVHPDYTGRSEPADILAAVDAR